MNTFDSPQGALGFLTSNLSYVAQEVLKQPYPDVKYPRFLNVDTAANEWADSVIYRTLDMKGRPRKLGTGANDGANAEIVGGTHSVKVEHYEFGFEYTIVELGKAQLIAQNDRSAGINYLSEKALAARTLTEQFLDEVAMIGDSESQFSTGMLNNADVDSVTTGTLLGGASQTIAQILDQADKEDAAADMLKVLQGAVSKVREDTKGTFTPNLVILPLAQYGRVNSFRIPNTAETLVGYLERVLNVKIDWSNYAADVDGNGDIMMVTTRDNYSKFHLPKPFALLPANTPDNVRFTSAGIVGVGGTDLQVPKAHLYVTGI